MARKLVTRSDGKWFEQTDAATGVVSSQLDVPNAAEVARTTAALAAALAAQPVAWRVSKNKPLASGRDFFTESKILQDLSDSERSELVARGYAVQKG